MDDFVHSFESIDIAEVSVLNVKSTLEKCGLNLTELVSNKPEALISLPQADMVEDNAANFRCPLEHKIRYSVCENESKARFPKLKHDTSPTTVITYHNIRSIGVCSAISDPNENPSIWRSWVSWDEETHLGHTSVVEKWLRQGSQGLYAKVPRCIGVTWNNS